MKSQREPDALDNILTHLISQKQAFLRVKTGSITFDEYVAETFKFDWPALMSLGVNKLTLDYVSRKQSPHLWQWEQIRVMTIDRIEHLNSSHDYHRLLRDIDRFLDERNRLRAMFAL